MDDPLVDFYPYRFKILFKKMKEFHYIHLQIIFFISNPYNYQNIPQWPQQYGT